MNLFDRITIDPKVFAGKPCIREMRFPVSKILDLLAAGVSPEDIIKEYHFLELADIRQAIKYACLQQAGRLGRAGRTS